MRRLLLITATLALTVAGCQPSLPSRALVYSLRILAVRASPPEVMPGATVTLDALIADPTGAGRALKQTWAICSPDAAGVDSCGDPSRITVLGTGAKMVWTAPANALAGLDQPHQVIGIDFFLVLGVVPYDDLAQSDPPHDVAIKRIRVSTNPSPNQNPGFASLMAAGQPTAPGMTVSPGGALALTARATPGSAEAWSLPDGTSGVETLEYSWSIDGAGVSYPVNYADTNGDAPNVWQLPAAGVGSDWHLWLVLRDGRGGTDWLTLPVVVK